MKTLSKIALILALTSVASIAAAKKNTGNDDMSFSGVSAGQTNISCVASGDSITLKISSFPLVRVADEGEFPQTFGAKVLHNKELNKDDFVAFPSEATSTGTMYVFGMGTDWQAMAKHVDQLDITKARGKGAITGGVASVTMSVKADVQWYRFNAIAEVNHVRGWVGAETQSGFAARDMHGNPLWVVGRNCEKPNAAVLAKAAEME